MSYYDSEDENEDEDETCWVIAYRPTGYESSDEQNQIHIAKVMPYKKPPVPLSPEMQEFVSLQSDYLRGERKEERCKTRNWYYI
jgi:hypothetical protein